MIAEIFFPCFWTISDCYRWMRGHHPDLLVPGWLLMKADTGLNNYTTFLYDRDREFCTHELTRVDGDGLVCRVCGETLIP